MQSSRACGPPEARQLRVWQRLGQLEDARHVAAAVGQIVVVKAVSEGVEQLSASKAINGRERFELAGVLEAGGRVAAFEGVEQRADALGGVSAHPLGRHTADPSHTADRVVGQAAETVQGVKGC